MFARGSVDHPFTVSTLRELLSERAVMSKDAQEAFAGGERGPLVFTEGRTKATPTKVSAVSAGRS